MKRSHEKMAISLPLVRPLAIGVLAALVLAGAAAGEVSKDGFVAEWHCDGVAKDN